MVISAWRIVADLFRIKYQIKTSVCLSSPCYCPPHLPDEPDVFHLRVLILNLPIQGAGVCLCVNSSVQLDF